MAQLIRTMTGITAAAALAALASAIGLPGHAQEAQETHKVQEAQKAEEGDDAPLRIVILSDSPLAAAFAGWIQEKLRDSVSPPDKVSNPDISYQNAADVLADLDRLVPEGTEAVILSLGWSDGRRGVDPTITGKALATILDRLAKRDIMALLCGARAPRYQTNTYTERFNAMFLKLSERNILSCPRNGNTALKSLDQAIEDDHEDTLHYAPAVTSELFALSSHIREHRKFAEFESTMANTPPAVPARDKAPYRIVVLGNSLIADLGPDAAESFPVRLRKALAAKGKPTEISYADIADRTAAQVLAGFNQFVPKGTEGVVLALGANDALHHIDPKTTHRAVVAITERLVGERDISTVFCANERYHAMYQQLSAEYALPVCTRLLGEQRSVDQTVYDMLGTVEFLIDWIDTGRETGHPKPETPPDRR